jgi:hypothetical protein
MLLLSILSKCEVIKVANLSTCYHHIKAFALCGAFHFTSSYNQAIGQNSVGKQNCNNFEASTGMLLTHSFTTTGQSISHCDAYCG